VSDPGGARGRHSTSSIPPEENTLIRNNNVLKWRWVPQRESGSRSNASNWADPSGPPAINMLLPSVADPDLYPSTFKQI
jgi:hypothetical protein